MNKLPINILQPQGPLFFASVVSLLNTYANSSNHKILIIDMKKVTLIDLSGVYALEDLILGAKAKDIKVIISGATPKIKNILIKLEFIKNIGSEYYIDSKDAITTYILKQIDQK